MVDDSAVTWGDLLGEVADVLNNQQEARWLCEHASGFDASEFDTCLTALVGERPGIALRRMVARRIAGEPLQYVMSRWAFRHLDLLVDKRVLIPRPETEVVVGAALEIANKIFADAARKIRIADLGTGSGVIGLSLASEMPRGATEVWLTDLSIDALEVARANLAGLGLINSDVRVAEGSWFAALPSELKRSFDLIVSNPPYIADNDPTIEPIVRDHEPSMALFAGHDGLDAHREIISQAAEWLVIDGWLVLEIGHDQGEVVREMLSLHSFTQIEIRQDYASRDRIALAKI